MVRTAYLRVYQPAAVFSATETARWLAHDGDGDPGHDRMMRRWLVRGALSAGASSYSAEGAFVRRFGDEVLICPWRTRLRVLVGMLAFRGSVPEEVADAFVPESQARLAAAELAELGEGDPQMRSHMLHANWHVPLRWFAAFDGSERILVEDRSGLRIRYETRLKQACERLCKAVEVLDSTILDEGITRTVRELVAWLGDFDSTALLELDYATVAGVFEDEDLLADQSATDVWTCLDALASGDADTAGRVFGELSDKWASVRALEAMN